MKVMSTPEKEILCKIVDESPLLEYKLKTLEMPEDYDDELVYDIPDEDKEKVFKEIYPFACAPEMEDVRLDLHSGKKFKVKDYLVIRSRNRNFIVSPYYNEAGGMVVDWITLDEPSLIEFTKK